MAYLKTELFDDDLQVIAKIAKVLSHPARLAILQYLAQQQDCVSGDISGEIPLSRTTVSQHLQELKKLGFIQGTVSGTRVNYCLNPEEIRVVKGLLVVFFTELLAKDTICSTTKTGNTDE